MKVRAVTFAALMVLSVFAMTPVSAAGDTQVSLQPASETVAVDGTVTYDLVVENIDGGVGAYSFDINSSDANVATITDVSLGGNPGIRDVSYADDGSGVSVSAAIADTADTGAVTIATVTVEGQSVGSVDITADITELGDENANTYVVTGINDTSLTVQTVSVTFEDQNTGGEDVYVDYDAGSDGEYVAVWNGNTLIGNAPVSGSGTVVVDFDEEISESMTLTAAVHSGSPSLDNILTQDDADVTYIQVDKSHDDPSVVPVHWQGQDIRIEGNFTAGEGYQVRAVERNENGNFVVQSPPTQGIRATSEDALILRTRALEGSYVIEDDSQSLAPGDMIGTELGDYEGFSFEVAEQHLEATIFDDSTEYAPGETVAIQLESVRSGFDVTWEYGTSDKTYASGSLNDLGNYEEFEIPIDAAWLTDDNNEGETSGMLTFNVDDTTASAETDEIAVVSAESDTQVSLQPASETVSVGGTVTYDLVVENVDGGVGAYSFDINSSDANVATITDVSLGGDPGIRDVSYADDGNGVSVVASLANTADTGSVTIATVTVEGQSAGDVDIIADVADLGDETGSPYQIASVSNASLTVEEIATPIVVGDSPATDVDGDNVLEDINGDGEFTPTDIQALFANRNSDAVQNNPALFDFNGDGSVSASDVQALFAQLF